MADYTLLMKSRDDKPPRAWNSTLPRPTKPLERSSTPIKRSKIKPKRRTSDEFQRIYGGAERVAFVKALACVASALSPHPCFGEVQNAHTENGGMSRKADANTIVPLCVAHHADFDRYKPPFDDHGVRAFVKLAAAQTQAEWDVFCRASRSSRT